MKARDGDRAAATTSRQGAWIDAGLSGASETLVEIGDFDESTPFPVPRFPRPPLGSLVFDREVSGSLASIAAAEDFETGALGPQWSTNTTGNGLIRLTGEFGTAGGDYALVLETTGISSSLTEAIWTVDLTGQTSARLIFSHADRDPENRLPRDFIGSANGDGVAISDDGIHWHTVYDSPNIPQGGYLRSTVDLAGAAADAGMTLGADFRIKFQQYAHTQNPPVNRRYDDISIQVAGDRDVFTIAVNQGQTITAALETEAPFRSPGLQARMEVSLNGTVLDSTTANAPGRSLLLQTIEAPGQVFGSVEGPMTYEIILENVGNTFGDYGLRLVLNAALEGESFQGPRNDHAVFAQDIEGSFVSLLPDVPDDRSGEARRPPHRRDRNPERAAVLGIQDAPGEYRTIEEIEPNHPPAGDPLDLLTYAHDLDRETFSLEPQSFITDSTTLPHATVGLRCDGTFDYFAFSIGSAPTRGVFDIDFAAFDTELFLYDSTGALLAENDKGPPDPGNQLGEEAFIDFVFSAPGRYVIGVGGFDSFDAGGRIGGEPPPLLGACSYALTVSLEDRKSLFDVYSFELGAGETVTLALFAEKSDVLSLELLDPSGDVVAADASVVDNGSFETGDFSGWSAGTTGTPYIPWRVSTRGFGTGFGLVPTRPRAGRFGAWNAFDGQGPMEFILSQDVSIPENTPLALLRWQDRLQWDFTLGNVATQPRIYEVEVRDPETDALLETLFSFSTGTQATNLRGDTGWQERQADLRAYAGSIARLTFRESIPEFGTGPGQLELDAIDIHTGGEDIEPVNVDRLIRNITVSESGTYYARVSGHGPEEYNLVVLRNADFGLDLEGDRPILFDEVAAGTLVDGAVIDNVTFGFSSPDATIGFEGPGSTMFIQPPNLEGSAFETLSLRFEEPVRDISYGFALNTNIPADRGTTMELFDVDGAPLGVHAAPAEFFGSFVEGTNSASSPVPIGSAVITFSSSTSYRFVFDNLASTVFSRSLLERSQPGPDLRHGDRAWVLSHTDGMSPDLYRLDLRPGIRRLNLRTFTPASQAGDPVGALDPFLRLLDAEGNLIASDDGSAPDGTNARIEYRMRPDRGEEPGSDPRRAPGGPVTVLYVEVSPSEATPGSTQGEYLLLIETADDHSAR